MNEMGQCLRSFLLIGLSVCIQRSDALAGEGLSSLYGWQPGSSWTVVIKSRVLDVEAPSARDAKPDRFQELEVKYTYKGLVTEGKKTFAEFILEVRREKESFSMRAVYSDEKGGYPVKIFGADGKKTDQAPRDVPLFIPRTHTESKPAVQDVGEEKARVKRISENQVEVQVYDVWQPSPSRASPPSHAKSFGGKGKEKTYVLRGRLVIDWPKGASWWRAYKRYHGRMELPVVEALLKD